ncbi:MAG: hypothetical protein R2852_01630 [Bacteroidia bacterium]
MTRLGLLGLGARSTEYYFNKLNKLYNLKNGGYSTFPMLLLNTNFNELNNLLPKPNDDLLIALRRFLQEFEKFEIDKVILPNITLHESLDILIDNQETHLKFIHPIELCISQLMQNGITQIMLFATRYTSNSVYFEEKFVKHGIELMRPTESEILFLDKFRKKVFASMELKEDIMTYNSLIGKYHLEFPIVVACSELSIVTKSNLTNVFDLAEIQIQDALL